MNDARDAATADRTAATAPAGGVEGMLTDLLRDLRTGLTARLDVAQIEVREAARRIVRVVATAAAAIVLGVSAWLAFCAALASGAVELGLSLPAALAVTSLLNAGLAAWLTSATRRGVERIGMPHTRRMLLDSGARAPMLDRREVAHAGMD